jgi:prevent-host-death family protein
VFVKIGDPNHKGNVAEAMIAARAVQAGVAVLRPQGEHGRYDLVFDLGGPMARIQCKWGRLEKDVIVVHLAGFRQTPQGAVRTRYSREEVDAFAVYCGALDRCFLIPFAAVEGQTGVQLRVRRARNGQRARLHFAADYEFQGAVAQLGERLRGTQEAVGSSPISSISGTEDSTAPAVTVGAHEFRNHFGWYLERAAAGEMIDVTRHGKAHVRLGPKASRLIADDAREAA